MSTLQLRIRERMQQLGMTQELLATKMGITRGAVTHYLAGRRVPPLVQFQKLAAVLKSDPAWLQYGSTLTQHFIPSETATTEKYSLPILSWEQTLDFMNIKKLNREKFENIPNLFTDKAQWFALRIKGDAMTAPLGNVKSFNEGDIIIIDPDGTPNHGNYVIALLPKAKEVTFKQLVIDGGISYLKPLNPQYPMVQMDERTHICGVLVANLSTI